MQWMTVPEFRLEYREARRQAFGQAIARLQQASSPAVTTLLKLAVDTNVPPAVRARSSYLILTLSKQSIEIDDINARLLELEQAVEDAKAKDDT